MNSRGRNVRLTLLCAAAAGAVLALAAGCQTYDFEPVQPLAVSQRTQKETIKATNLKPNLYLLVDRSGSMNGPTDPTNPNCAEPDGGVCGPAPSAPCDTSVCPTRWSDMQNAMHQFMTNDGTVARMGLSFFPSQGTACGPSAADAVPMDSSVDDPTSLQNTANAIDSAILASTPGGGTPTANSLTFVGQQYGNISTTNRESFVLLLTDGLPNCDSSLDPSTCTCTESSCSAIGGIGCLDENATVNEITALQGQNPAIKTIVVGFGADTASGIGPQVLTAMANAGGFPKSCPNGTDAECGSNDTCNTTTKVCNTPYYQASNGADLAATLAAIGGVIGQGNPCLFALDQAPSDPSLLSVLINGTETPGCSTASGCNTWTYDSASVAIDFQGQLCDTIKSSNAGNPVTVEVQIVKSL